MGSFSPTPPRCLCWHLHWDDLGVFLHPASGCFPARGTIKGKAQGQRWAGSCGSLQCQASQLCTNGLEPSSSPAPPPSGGFSKGRNVLLAGLFREMPGVFIGIFDKLCFGVSVGKVVSEAAEGSLFISHSNSLCHQHPLASVFPQIIAAAPALCRQPLSPKLWDTAQG